MAPRSHSRRAAPQLVAPDLAAAATTWEGGREGGRLDPQRQQAKEEEPLELEPPLPESPFGTRSGCPSMPLSLSYCQYHRAAESMAHAQPNLLGSSARPRRPLTGCFKREARPHWPASAFTPMPACAAERRSGIGGGGAETLEGGKRGERGLGGGRGTRMRPRAPAALLPLPPGGWVA